MTETAELTLRFLRLHPETAAGVLESLRPEDAAAYLQQVPPKLAAPVWAAMLPAYAARCVAQCNQEYAVSVVAAMPSMPASAMLRAMPKDAVDALIQHLPGRTAFALRLLLRYPVGTVGAWMEPAVSSLPAGITVLDAWIRLRRDADVIDRFLYVVDREQRLMGRVSTADLLRAEGDRLLERFLVAAPAVLSARADLGGAVAEAAWRECDPLPVVARDGRFLGVAHYAVLCHGEQAARDGDTAPSPGGPLMDLVEAYWSGLARLVEAPFHLLSADSKRSGDGGVRR